MYSLFPWYITGLFRSSHKHQNAKYSDVLSGVHPANTAALPSGFLTVSSIEDDRLVCPHHNKALWAPPLRIKKGGGGARLAISPTAAPPISVFLILRGNLWWKSAHCLCPDRATIRKSSSSRIVSSVIVERPLMWHRTLPIIQQVNVVHYQQQVLWTKNRLKTVPSTLSKMSPFQWDRWTDFLLSVLSEGKAGAGYIHGEVVGQPHLWL